jgi:hypothetical protein
LSTHDVSNTLDVLLIFHIWKKMLLMKTWHLVYIYHHFSIITNYYLPYAFDTLKICWYSKGFLECLNIEKTRHFSNKWTKGCHASKFMNKVK